MTRIFLAVLVAGVLLLVAAVVILGEFPPNPTPHPVQRVIPNDKFQPPH